MVENGSHKFVLLAAILLPFTLSATLLVPASSLAAPKKKAKKPEKKALKKKEEPPPPVVEEAPKEATSPAPVEDDREDRGGKVYGR